MQGLNNIKITFIETVFVRNDTTDRHMGCESAVSMVTLLRTGRQPIGFFFRKGARYFSIFVASISALDPPILLLCEYLQQNECDTKLTAPFCLIL